MIGKIVKHSLFGTGKIIAQTEKFITVQFAEKISGFVYPDAFEKFIVAEDPAVQAKAIKFMEEKRLEEEQQRQAKEEARNTLSDGAAAVATKTKTASKPMVRTHREDGKIAVFYVFQGNTFAREYQGGYIWAPIADRSGSEPHHWARLQDVREGDIILHGCNAHLQAVSIVKSAAYAFWPPEEVETEGLMGKEGRRVDCEYTNIEKPIKTSIYADDIIRLCKARYSPFDKDGNGNMGYLYEINRELAKIFLRASVAQNPYLAEIEYVEALLSEDEE